MATKAKEGPTKQKDAPEGLTGDYDVYRLRGYVHAKPLEDGTYSVCEDGDFYIYEADDFHAKYINVPPAKLDNTEHGSI